MIEILKEVATLSDIEDATGKCILLWVCRIEVQRAHQSTLNGIKEAKDSHIVRQNMKSRTMTCSKCARDRTHANNVAHDTHINNVLYIAQSAVGVGIKTTLRQYID